MPTRRELEASAAAAQIPREPWDRFVAAFRWGPGEHMTVIGPTGRGKTTVALELLKKRRYAVVVATKPTDENLARLAYRSKRQPGEGWTRITKWPPPHYVDRVLYWPPVKEMGDTARQRDELHRGLRAMFKEGGWTIYIDELRYAVDPNWMALRPELELIWQQGRSLDISLVSSLQRGAWVPQLAFDQARHLLLFNDPDKGNQQRVGEMNAANKDTVIAALATLGDHDFLHVDTWTGDMRVSRAPKPPGR